MQSTPFAAFAVLLATVAVVAQQPAVGRPVFEVVSIRPSPGSIRLSNSRERPGGGYALEKGTAQDVIGYAYALAPTDIVG